MIQNPAVLGIDIGGTHITAALVDLKTGTLLIDSITRTAVDSKSDKEEILNAWCEVIEKAFGSDIDAVRQIGVAIPGPFDYEKGISLIKEQNKFKSLYQIDLKEELAGRLLLPSSAIRFVNDAAAFLQGEIFAGAAKGFQKVLGLTLGTGLGSAITHNGNAKDAELWCSPFKDSIAEDYLSTKWFLSRYKELTGETILGVKELANLTDIGPLSRQVFEEFGANLAEFLAPIIHGNKSEVVILGGNIAQAFPLFSNTLTQKLVEDEVYAEIKLSELNEYATLIGAASQCDLVVK